MPKPKTAKQKVAEAKRNLCSDLKLIHDVNVQEAGTAVSNGDVAGAVDHATSAGKAKADANRWGCGWAQ
jgi:hypothetical protein